MPAASAPPLTRRTLCAGLAALTVAHGLSARAQDTNPRYQAVPRSPDGIGKAYMGREIAAVMGWQGAAWLEREQRDREERADVLVRELRLEPGQDVADVGAGTGFHARRMARVVAPGGTVFAVDVQPRMLQMLERLARDAGIVNIRPVLATESDTRLAPRSIDLALLVDAYHELAYPFEVMQGVVQALRPDGRIALVEYRAEDPNVPIKSLHKMSLAQILREMSVHPLAHERTSDALPWQHLVVFRRRS